MPEHKLTDQDMVDILEDIAANSRSATARIAAIKVLREIRGGSKPVADGFSELDAAGDELARRRGHRTKAA